MPVTTRRAEIYDLLADILANTTQEKIALVAFQAMRNLNPRGALFIASLGSSRTGARRSSSIRSPTKSIGSWTGACLTPRSRPSFGLTVAGCGSSEKSGTACRLG